MELTTWIGQDFVGGCSCTAAVTAPLQDIRAAWIEHSGSPGDFFLIDNIVITSDATPEPVPALPGPLGLAALALALGLAGIATLRRKRPWPRSGGALARFEL